MSHSYQNDKIKDKNKNIITFVVNNWEYVCSNPLSDYIKDRLILYANSLMAKRNFINEQVADDIAEEVILSTYEKLGPDIRIHGPQKYSAYLVNGIKWKVSRYFYGFRKVKKSNKIEKNDNNDKKE